ncbi:MAG: DUF1611 domain-containing protein [Enterobacterales bacterium]|nr:DUF1611 domain-containing protein [Enterobacterales bacterium]
MTIKPPFLLLLGDAHELGYIKTALGLIEWRPDDCLGQLRITNDCISAGLPDMTLAEAKAAGIKTLIIGVAPAGGRLPDNWMTTLKEALFLGFDIASGLHDKLNDYNELVEIAKSQNTQLLDLRSISDKFTTGTGIKRTGKRLMTVGTDCAVGKKYTALCIYQALRDTGIRTDFRATGQTGILLTGSGIPIDATIADFTAGAAEALSPDNEDAHWDIIEGQGAIFHPAYSGVCLSLLHGSQPDAMVLCHDPSRPYLLGHDSFKVPGIAHCISSYEMLARLTNPEAKVIAVTINSRELGDRAYQEYKTKVIELTGLVCCDPLREGVAGIIESLIQK